MPNWWVNCVIISNNKKKMFFTTIMNEEIVKINTSKLCAFKQHHSWPWLAHFLSHELWDRTLGFPSPAQAPTTSQLYWAVVSQYCSDTYLLECDLTTQMQKGKLFTEISQYNIHNLPPLLPSMNNMLLICCFISPQELNETWNKTNSTEEARQNMSKECNRAEWPQRNQKKDNILLLK